MKDNKKEVQKDLKIIKSYYGEDMMHFCRSTFPTLLEKKGELPRMLMSNFEPNKSLLLDLKNQNMLNFFMDILYSEIYNGVEFPKSDKSPYELMNEVGYDLYECKTDEDINRFRKYYAAGEELCTFGSNRLDECHVFFAVKKNVDEIKRADIPNRQDEYGTSVISIQFTKWGNHLSIKNRYNHKVVNSDATFSNNLENINIGLTDSFNKEFNYNIKSNILTDFAILTNYTMDNTGKYHKYNYEINKKFYCTNGVIIENGVANNKYKDKKERYILADYFVIDLKKKEITLYDKTINDQIIDNFKDIKDIKITYGRNVEDKMLSLVKEDGNVIYMQLDGENKIVGYKDDYLKIMKDNTFKENIYMKYMDVPNVRFVGDNCLKMNRKMKVFEGNNIIRIGNHFLYKNEDLHSLNLNSVNIIGDNDLFYNTGLRKIYLPNARMIGNSFMFYNFDLEKAYMPKVIIIGNSCFKYNTSMKKLNLNSLEYIGDSFFEKCKSLEEININNLKKAGDYVFSSALGIVYIDTPSLVSIGGSFLKDASLVESFYAPNLIKVGPKSLENAKKLNPSNYYAPCFIFKNGNFIKVNNESIEEGKKKHLVIR